MNVDSTHGSQLLDLTEGIILFFITQLFYPRLIPEHP